MSTPSSPSVIRASHQFAIRENVAILRYARTTGIESVVDLEEFAGALRQGAVGAVFPVLTLIEAGAAPPSSEQRRRLAALWTTFSPVIQGISYALPGSGFGAATRRAVITGLQLLARSPFPVHVASELESAADWLCHRFPAPERTVERLVDAVRALVIAGESPSA